MHDVIAALGVIFAAGVSGLAAVLVARLRVENGAVTDLLRSIDKRTLRIDTRLFDHAEKIGRHSEKLGDHEHRIGKLERKPESP